MDWPPIFKSLTNLPVQPNLVDYDKARADFSWEAIRKELSGLPNGGLNIAHEAVDRHAGGPRRDHLALRWLGADGATRDFSYRDSPKAATGSPIWFQASMRRAIAAAMARSNRDIPHYYLQTRIDVTRALRWLEAENAKRSIKDRLLPAVLTLKAVALALKEVPELNGFWINDQHQPSDAIHVGFAISLRKGGLVTPAIHETDRKTLDELMAAMRDVIDRARSGSSPCL